MTDIDYGAIKDILAYDSEHPLLFNTGLFMLLFLGFILIYQAIRRWHNAKMIFVILFSLYFYYKSSYYYCLILLGVAVSDYLLGLLMGRVRQHRWAQRAIICVNVAINVGMLVYFKYFNLLYETFANITGTSFDPLDIVLPAGISFFTFRSISYLVDIYRGQLEPARNFLQYVFFLTFFPPLLAGPVVRAKDMLPQIALNPIATRMMVSEGFFLIMCGIVKKVIVSDYISGNFVTRVFENPSLYSGFENLMGIIGFTIQIYCDFSGYSDMAIGLALLLGYRFKDNFNSPYKAQNPTEFWKRWHISLSSWLMDYVYIPLGGNRKGRARQHANLMTTMLVGGIWHGASWIYLLWGGYHGLLLIGHKTIHRYYRAPERMRGRWYMRTANIIITFILMAIGMAIFNAGSIDKLGEMFTQIFNNFHPEVIRQFVEGYMLIVVLILGALILHFVPDWVYRKMLEGYNYLPFVVQGIILALVLFAAVQFGQSSLVPFIYLQY